MQTKSPSGAMHSMGSWSYLDLTCRLRSRYYIYQYVMDGRWNPRSLSRDKPQFRKLSVNTLGWSRVIGLSSLCILTVVWSCCRNSQLPQYGGWSNLGTPGL